MPGSTELIGGRFRRGDAVRYVGPLKDLYGRYGLLKNVLSTGPKGTRVIVDGLGGVPLSTSVSYLENATLEDYEYQCCIDRLDS